MIRCSKWIQRLKFLDFAAKKGTKLLIKTQAYAKIRVHSFYTYGTQNKTKVSVSTCTLMEVKFCIENKRNQIKMA